MTNHSNVTREVAADIRAALAKKNKTAGALAVVLNRTPHTAGRRLSGAVPFSVVELITVCAWLDIDIHDLIPATPVAA